MRSGVREWWNFCCDEKWWESGRGNFVNIVDRWEGRDWPVWRRETTWGNLGTAGPSP